MRFSGRLRQNEAFGGKHHQEEVGRKRQVGCPGEGAGRQREKETGPGRAQKSPGTVSDQYSTTIGIFLSVQKIRRNPPRNVLSRNLIKKCEMQNYLFLILFHTIYALFQT